MEDLTLSYSCIPPIPVENKFNLTIKEAAAYFGIGEGTLRNLIDACPNANFILNVGTKKLIKRTVFEEWIINHSHVS